MLVFGGVDLEKPTNFDGGDHKRRLASWLEMKKLENTGYPAPELEMLGLGISVSKMETKQQHLSRWWLILDVTNGMKTCIRTTSWFQRFFIFIPILGEMIQYDEHMVQMGWFNHQLETSCPFFERDVFLFGEEVFWWFLILSSFWFENSERKK